jgi:hypothetical protein
MRNKDTILLENAYESILENLDSQTSKRQTREVSEEEYSYLMSKFPHVKEDKFQASLNIPHYYVEYIGSKEDSIKEIKPYRFVYEFVAHFG